MMLVIPMTVSRRFPSILAGIGLAALIGCFGAVPASAQSIKAVVNGSPITSLEIQQRKALVLLTEKKNLSNKQATDLLVDEALIKQEAAKRRITISDAEVDSRYGSVAASTKLTLPQLAQALAQGGTSDRAFKQFIHAQLLHRKLLSSRFDPSRAVKESDISAQLAQRKDQAKASHRYTVRQVIFVLPKNAGAGEVQRRRQEAASFRGRFSSCDEAAGFARNLKNVAVKDPTIRSTSQLGETLDKQLAGLKIGGMTSPERGENGVEMIMLCDRASINDDSALRQKIQFELADEQFKVERENIIADLRKRAIIEYR